MIQFIKQKDRVLFVYRYGDRAHEEFYNLNKLNKSIIEIKRGIFTFEKEDQVFFGEIEENTISDYDSDFELPPTIYEFAELEDGHFKIKRGVLVGDCDIFLDKDFDFKYKYFVAETGISIFGNLNKIVEGDIFVSNSKEETIPLGAFYDLIDNFPNSYEKKLYAQKQIFNRMKEFVNPSADYADKYNSYRNEKISRQGNDLLRMFADGEEEKYKTILEKMEWMLVNEDSFSEAEWQKAILEIIQLLYPKYVKVLEGVSAYATNGNPRYADFGLLDINGHLDLIEIKRPDAGNALRDSEYRNNFYPTRELTGTIMQLEKYIFYFIKGGKSLENRLTQKYRDDLPNDLKINIVNPTGIIIMGREKDLTEAQREDYEVIKRKYKNILDIISYDDLIHRLKTIIEQIKKH